MALLSRLKDGDEKMRGYLKYLNAIGFVAITKPLKKIRVGGGEQHPNSRDGFIYKANFDVELKDSGRKVTVYASRKTISWELKLAASEVVYLEHLRGRLHPETIKTAPISQGIQF